MPDPVEAAKWAISALPPNLTSHPVDALAERLSQFSCLSSTSHPVDASISQSTNVKAFSDLRLAPVLTLAVNCSPLRSLLIDSVVFPLRYAFLILYEVPTM